MTAMTLAMAGTLSTLLALILLQQAIGATEAGE